MIVKPSGHDFVTRFFVPTNLMKRSGPSSNSYQFQVNVDPTTQFIRESKGCLAISKVFELGDYILLRLTNTGKSWTLVKNTKLVKFRIVDLRFFSIFIRFNISCSRIDCSGVLQLCKVMKIISEKCTGIVRVGR